VPVYSDQLSSLSGFQTPQPHFRKSIVFTATNAMKTMLSASLMEQYSILVFNNLK
jgi:hypothetical protein